MGPSSQGGESFWFFFARTHFLACEGVAGWSQQSGGESFFPDTLPCVQRCSWWVPAIGGQIIFCRTHFLASEDVAGGSQQSGGESFFCPDALPCVRRCRWWVPAVRWEMSFREIRWPVRWVPVVRWRNNYLARNKEALPCCGHGPSCQPLHLQSTSDGSRSLTTLTTPRREHQGGGQQ